MSPRPAPYTLRAVGQISGQDNKVSLISSREVLVVSKVSIYVSLVAAMSDMKDDKNNVDAPVALAAKFRSEH